MPREISIHINSKYHKEERENLQEIAVQFFFVGLPWCEEKSAGTDDGSRILRGTILPRQLFTRDFCPVIHLFLNCSITQRDSNLFRGPHKQFDGLKVNER